MARVTFLFDIFYPNLSFDLSSVSLVDVIAKLCDLIVLGLLYPNLPLTMHAQWISVTVSKPIYQCMNIVKDVRYIL